MRVARYTGKSISAVLSLVGLTLLVLSVPSGILTVITGFDMGYVFLAPILGGLLGFLLPAGIGLALVITFLQFASPRLAKKLDIQHSST